MKSVRLAALLVSVMATAAIAAPAAHAAPANIIAGNGAANVFNPTTYTHDGGTLATMTWAGGAGPHNVTSATPGLFSSATIPSGSTPVNGTQFLSAGSYPFSCTVHPGMNGTLNVVGAPLPAPSATVVIKSKTVEEVVKSRKLRVQVTHSAGATGKLVVTLGTKRKIGTHRNLDATAITIGKSGRRALAGLETAKIKVTAQVDFGSYDTTSKKLK